MIKFRWQRGSLEDSLATAIEFDSLKELFRYIVIGIFTDEYFKQLNYAHIRNSFEIKYYGHDTRCKQYLYIVTIDKKAVGFIFEEVNNEKVDIKDLSIGDEVWVKARLDETSIIIGGIHIHLAPTIKNSLYIEETQPRPAKEQFRPHWSIVDDGGHGKEVGKVYADEDNMMINNGCYLLGAYVDTIISNAYYEPHQERGKETDFGILDSNGDCYKAFWKGNADE